MTLPSGDLLISDAGVRADAARGAEESVAALKSTFGPEITRSLVSNGQAIVYVSRARAHTILAWLKDDSTQRFDYLTDVTCVEYRDPERPFEVVYQLRSLSRRVDLRVKIALDAEGTLEVDSVRDLWAGCDWLEREAFDMFGVVFLGHPDLRRILMWETYAEGNPLRKSFPLRGRWSRAEQTRQALTLATDDNYTSEELTIADVTREFLISSSAPADEDEE